MPNVADGFIGSKATISYWDVSQSPDAYTAYAQVQNFGDIGRKAPEVEKTTLDSDAVERRPGLPDTESVTIMVNLNAAGFAILKAQVDAGTKLDLKVNFTPAGIATILYLGFIPLGYKIGKVDAKKLLECSLEGRITGDISTTDPHA